MQGRPPRVSNSGRYPGDARGGGEKAAPRRRSERVNGEAPRRIVRMSFTAIIPARFASSRFPGKALADIGGKPMVVRVAERARDSGARDVFNPDIVKVVMDHAGMARYFSRAPVPWARDAFADSTRSLPQGLPCYRHIGIYAYRADFLRSYPRLERSPLEEFEALEQLRALWHGYAIAVALRQDAPLAGVDTVEDLERTRSLFDRTVHNR